MTRLVIVRHGETAWNAQRRVQGQIDVPLNETGRRQAEALAAALAGERLAAIWSSDLARARETAAAAAARLGLPVRLEPALRERHYGIFETLTYAEAKARYPEDYARFERREPDYDFRTGESLRAFYERAVGCVRSIAALHAGESVLVFTHGGVLDKVYRFVTGMAITAPRDFAIPNCGINRLAADPWRILVWADVSHLESALDDLPE
ncbi:MAG: histidine phosphatase family protein [Burkholderiales bacterium]|nr:histidine phosphatase family protein [Burkholderiales bacterium]